MTKHIITGIAQETVARLMPSGFMDTTTFRWLCSCGREGAPVRRYGHADLHGSQHAHFANIREKR